jgi:hypothetical protein
MNIKTNLHAGMMIIGTNPVPIAPYVGPMRITSRFITAPTKII